eukprot:gene3572-7103_t
MNNSNSREHITIQLGHFSNYIGSHYWNIQHELLGQNVDGQGEIFQSHKLFRSIKGKIGSEEKYPRALIFDLRDNLGSLNPHWDVEDEVDDDSLAVWDHAIKIIKEDDDSDDNIDNEQKKIDPSHPMVDENIHLSNSIESWSDYLNPRFHARSFCIPSVWRDATSTCQFGRHDISSHPFSNYLSGKDRSLITNEYRDAFFDNFRLLVEDCGNASHVNVLVDVESGFGGFASDFLTEIREEMPKINMVDPVSSSHSSDISSTRSLSLPLLYHDLFLDDRIASVVIPMDPSAAMEHSRTSPFVHPLDTASTSKSSINASAYHTSAILAVAIETIQSVDIILPQTSLYQSFEPATDWISAVTNRGSFPLYDNLFFRPTSFPPPLPLLNPFMNTLSPICRKSYNDYNLIPSNHFNRTASTISTTAAAAVTVSGDSRNSVIERKKKAYTNVLSVRGLASPDLPSSFFQQCIGTKYLVSQVHQRHTQIPLSSDKFPRMFQDVDDHCMPTVTTIATTTTTSNDPRQRHQQQQQHQHHHSSSVHHHHYNNPTGMVSSCSSVAAVGCDSTTGAHLTHVTERWGDSIRSSGCRAHLDNCRLYRDECEEIREKLRNGLEM